MDQPKPKINVDGTWLEGISHAVLGSKWIVFFCLVGLSVLGTFYYSAKARVRRGTQPSTAGLNYVVGPMGAGKSLFGVDQIMRALVNFKYVVTNIRLLPGWEDRLIDHYFTRDGRNAEKRAALVEKLREHYVFERSLGRAMRYRVPCAKCGLQVSECGHSGQYQEARATFVWDESHNDLNNRDYQGFGADRAEREREKEMRRMMVRFATQMRKLGYSGYLLSQHHENTDAQLRRVCNHIIRLQNQRMSEGGGLQKMLPKRFTVFLQYWYPAHLATGVPEHMIKPVRMDWMFLPWYRVLYDSWETFHGIDDVTDEFSPIYLGGGKREVAGVPGLAPGVATDAAAAAAEGVGVGGTVVGLSHRPVSATEAEASAGGERSEALAAAVSLADGSAA